MNKRLIVLVATIIAIIVASSVFVFLSKDRNAPGLPHYRQAFLKFTGTATFFASEKGKFTLLFVDEEKYSEFSKDYIENIYVLDEKNNRYEINNWAVTTGESNKRYTKKKIEGEVVFDKSGTVGIKAVEVVFADGVTEIYDIGFLSINVYTDDDYLENYCPGFFDVSFIYSTKDKHKLSGLQFIINSYNEEYRIKSIDFNVPEIAVDADNVIKYDGENLSLINNARENKESWVGVFDSPKLSREPQTKTKTLDITIGNKENLNTYTTISVPIVICEGEGLWNRIISFSPVIQCIYKGEVKYLKTPVSEIYNPFIRNPEFNYVKYLEEEGV